MLKYIRCLLLTIFTPFEEHSVVFSFQSHSKIRSWVLFFHSNHIPKSVREKLALRPSPASHRPWAASPAAAVESPFHVLSALPVLTWNLNQAHHTRCRVKTNASVEVSSRCVSLLTTAVCHTPVLFPHLLQGAQTAYRWRYTPYTPTPKTNDFENNNFNIKWSQYQ